jgi:hypothetical protein
MDIDITDAILAEAHISICQFFERIRMLMAGEKFSTEERHRSSPPWVRAAHFSACL